MQLVMKMKINEKDLIKISEPLTTGSYFKGLESNIWTTNESKKEKNDENKVTVTQVSQKKLKTIGIYDNEWQAVSNNIKEMYQNVSKSALGNLLDGIVLGLLVPFAEAVYHFVNSTTPQELKTNSEACKFYFYILCGATIFVVIRKLKWPKWISKHLSTYKDFETDLKYAVERINEIDERLKIKKEEE